MNLEKIKTIAIETTNKKCEWLKKSPITKSKK